MENLLTYKDIISLVANIATILAFILAILAFFNWKKEQKNSKKLDYVMELEDSFEVLMHDIRIEFKWFSDLEKNYLDTDKKSKEYKTQLYDFIKNEFVKYQSERTIENSFLNYSLALTRVKRFLNTIDEECPVLDYEYLRKISIEAVELKPKWKDQENISDKTKEFLENFTNIHKKGLNCLQKKYK